MEAKLKTEKNGNASKNSRKRSFSRPSWLLCTIADLDTKMKKLVVNIPNKGGADSFTERADAYYQKRPQLLALLEELYGNYLSLADRYCQTLAKNHHRQNSFHYDHDNDDQFDKEEKNGSEIIDSDAESSLSYQPPFPSTQAKFEPDMIIADLVIRSVDCEIILHELSQVDKHRNESSRKIELQESLLELLESERLILLNENARLGYKVGSLMEENKGLSSESLFMQRKVAELARCMLNRRENHRVCMLSRKVEDLQGQIYGLERRNNEYYEQLLKHEEEKRSRSKMGLKGCFKVPEEAVVGNVKKGEQQREVGKKVPKFWDRVKKLDVFLCAPEFN
ncbi:kinase-interacting family protein-like [Solanum pennellii]|uniref:Kinase-interacting family protein-like n=1 Tax=Solanum pennellii TaxID=28526 RepID=A0ABM1H1M7_SOLPN|nr:kinase-interacting family protein-like [Solanum pennellii]XP_015079118.1 kinase-interacting family protein-like [Solanum pennellii]